MLVPWLGITLNCFIVRSNCKLLAHRAAPASSVVHFTYVNDDESTYVKRHAQTRAFHHTTRCSCLSMRKRVSIHNTHRHIACTASPVVAAKAHAISLHNSCVPDGLTRQLFASVNVYMIYFIDWCLALVLTGFTSIYVHVQPVLNQSIDLKVFYWLIFAIVWILVRCCCLHTK